MSDIEIDYCERKLYASTMGRGAWVADLIDDFSKELEVTTNTTWTDKRIRHSVVRVKDNATLTVTGDVKFPKNGKLIVEPGAKLLVDGGTLTNAGGENWQGVQVWGVPAQMQQSNNAAGGAQGVVELKNGAKVENAVCGVMLARCEGCTDKTGGIIIADDATFRNNRKDVAFMRYDKKSHSRFTRCTFLTDAAMSDPSFNGQGSNTHVSIWGVNNVTFTDCAFVCDLDDSFDSNDQSQTFLSNKRGVGIGIADANVKIQKSLMGLGCTFTNLSKGLEHNRTYGDAGIRRFDCSNATFDNCMQSVTLNGCDMDRFANNTFNVPTTDYESWSWGLYAIKCRNYFVNGNFFNGVDENHIAFGTLANGHMWLNSLIPLSIGGSGGKVLGNHYSGLRIGSQTEQYNPFLQLRCNDYTGTYASWAINPSGYFEPDGYGGYLGPQGTGCDPDVQLRAGNLFHDAGDHIWSWATPEKYYYANPQFGNNDPDNAPVENSVGYFMDLTGCQILSEDGSCEESNTEFTTLLPERRAMAESMELLEAEYSDRYTALDSGNTPLLLAHLADSTYSNATLVGELGASGLLSDTVLKAMCVRHPFFNDNHFTQLLINNSPVSWPVWVGLRDIAFGKLKSELQDSIAAAQLTDTLRTMEVVRRELMAASSAHEKMVNQIIDLFLNADSIPAMIHFLTDSIGTKECRKRAVGAALSIDTVAWARAILDSLELTTANDSAFFTYYDLALNLAEDTLTWFDLDSTQLAAMWALAGTNHEVAIHAEGVLALVLDTTFARIPEPLPPPPSERLAGPENVSSINTAHSGVRVYPNPFTDDFIVAYQFGNTATEMMVEVYDPLGRRVKQTTTRAIGSGTTSIDLGECLGLYLLRVSANGKPIHSQRVVCVK